MLGEMPRYKRAGSGRLSPITAEAAHLFRPAPPGVPECLREGKIMSAEKNKSISREDQYTVTEGKMVHETDEGGEEWGEMNREEEWRAVGVRSRRELEVGKYLSAVS